MPGIIGERFFTLFDQNKDGYANREEFISSARRLLSQKFEDNIKVVFEIYDFDNDGLVSREDIRVLLSYVPLSQILADKKDEGRKEGAFTKSGGGLYGFLFILVKGKINDSEVYLDRVQSQEELAKLLSYCMKDKEKINLEEFTQITEKLSCEMFLCVCLHFLLLFSGICKQEPIDFYVDEKADTIL